ncbi:general amino acid permease Agp3p [[Candida] jaroonii]|uniref:General amino acid permease Agp3p n=1 Tax=[Candida] jaroonii TaxID=467808 RepID=A0ACA9Y4M0_9ASCO|nr:general amino acid permease Agp3p [[Candida] jaroonii]
MEKSDNLVAEVSVVSAYHENEKGDTLLDTGLKAGIKNRMINLIALCGIIGPGTMIGMGAALAAGGPAGLIVGFTVVGILVLGMMAAIGELNSAFDFNFAVHGSRYISKGFGATLSVYYVIIWVMNIISEYVSLTSSLESYSDKVPTYGWYLIFWFIFTLFQCLNVSWWGEAEYILGFVKIGFLCGFYLFSIIYAAGGIPGHKPDDPFGNFPLNSGFKGIANSFVYAGVFYSGVEGISIIAAESRNPRKAIPTAVTNTIYRIFFVYYGLSVAYGISVPYNDPLLASSNKVMKSPMTIALTNAGWANAKYYVTTMVMITCFSSINSAIYFASRSLFVWSKQGYGPKIFAKTDKRGVPFVAIHSVHLLGFLSILSYSTTGSLAYGYIVNVAGVASFIVWTCICVTHIRFRKGLVAQGYDLKILPFKAPFFPYLDYICIALGILLTLVQGWSSFKPFDYKSFVDGYILLPLFPIIWFCYDYFFFKSGFIKYEQMDFETGKRPDLDDNVGEALDETKSNT